jgi:hypothetical protein
LFPSSRAIRKEHVTIEEVFDAYYDCRKNKRSKASAVRYEMNYELNNLQLWKDLNDMTYRPTTSIAFCVTIPKLREVFASDFRDRIVHHLFINKINGKIESMLTDSTCACRKGKGSLYAARRLRDMMETEKDGWYARCDIQGFFMSIDKNILSEIVNDVVRSSIDDDLAWWLWLADTLIWHRPEKDCDLHGNVRLWNDLPDNKTLFKTNGYGLPIGNLTSQVLANLYLADFDSNTIGLLGSDMRFIRYADDFIMIHPDKKILKNIIMSVRRWLMEERHIRLHTHKVCIQPVCHGVRFVGYFVKGGIIHTSYRLRANALKVCSNWSMSECHSDEERLRLMSRYNSYSGLMKHTASYRIRRKMWRSLGDYENITNTDMNKINVK